MPGATARSTRKAPPRFTSRTSSHSASDILSRLRSRVIPALFTSRTGARGRPRTTALTAGPSVMSTAWNRRSPPGGPASRSRTWTSAPSAARRSAMPRPIPRAPPVTTAARPSNRTVPPAIPCSAMARLPGSAGDLLHEGDLLRRHEPGAREEPEQRALPPLDLRHDPLRAQAREVQEELLEERRPHAPATVVRVHRDRVEDGGRLRAPVLPELHARHEEPGDPAVLLGDERHADGGPAERLRRLARVVGGAVAPGDLPVEADDRGEVALRHGPHRQLLLGRHVVGEPVHRPLEDDARREPEPGGGEERGEPAIAPVHLRPQLAHVARRERRL